RPHERFLQRLQMLADDVGGNRDQQHLETLAADLPYAVVEQDLVPCQRQEVLALELEDLRAVLTRGERKQHAGQRGRLPRQGQHGPRRVDALAPREADDRLRQHLPSLGGMVHTRQRCHRGVGQAHLEEPFGHVRHHHLMGGDVDADAVEEIDAAQPLRELGPVHDSPPSAGIAGSTPSQGARRNQRMTLGPSVSSPESSPTAATEARPRSCVTSARPSTRTVDGVSSTKCEASDGSTACTSACTRATYAVRSLSWRSFRAAAPSESLPRSNAIRVTEAVLRLIVSLWL